MSERSLNDLDGLEDVRYDSRTDTYNITLAPGTVNDLGATIAMTVAAVSNSDCEELPPIADVIDPDSLDTIFELSQSTDDQNRRRLTFEFATRRVSVHSDGSLVLQPLSDPNSGF